MAGCFSWSMKLDARNGGAMQSMLMPYFAASIHHALEFVHGCIKTVAFDLRISADVSHAIAGEVLEVHFIGWRGLASQFHQNRS